MSEEKKIKVVLLEPGKLARTAEIDASLAGMQKVVGGLIEPFYPFEEQVCIVCNEESKINGMRPNRSVKNDDGVMVDFIFGPAFICDCRGENLDSLSDEQIDRYFAYSEQANAGYHYAPPIQTTKQDIELDAEWAAIGWCIASRRTAR